MNCNPIERDRHPLTPSGMRLVGQKAGLLTDAPLYHRQRSDPEFYTTHARTNDVDALLEVTVEDWSIGGGETSLDASVMSVAGETAERYCTHQQYGFEPTVASYDDLVARGESVVDFEYLDVLPDVAYERVPELEQVTRGTTLRWHEGTDLTTGERVYVPAQLVYHTPFEGTDFPQAFVSTSSGSACGETMADALVGGLRELLERDGFVRTWLLGRTPDRVDVSPFPELAELKSEKLENEHLDFHVLSYDSPVEFPTLGCAVVDERRRNPKFVLAGGASPDPKLAIEDALLEGAQVWTNFRTDFARLDELAFDPETATDLTENVRHYALAENFDAVAYLLDGPTVAADELPANDSTLDVMVEELRANDCTPIAFDLTTRDVEQLGWHVGRVVVPELLSFKAPATPPLNHPELEECDVTLEPHPMG